MPGNSCIYNLKYNVSRRNYFSTRPHAPALLRRTANVLTASRKSGGIAQGDKKPLFCASRLNTNTLNIQLYKNIGTFGLSL
jgi:hypothetical protein